jgi:hypothetical protein
MNPRRWVKYASHKWEDRNLNEVSEKNHGFEFLDKCGV